MHRKSDTLYEDAMIAATAYAHGLVVTRNVADFRVLMCLIRLAALCPSFYKNREIASLMFNLYHAKNALTKIFHAHTTTQTS